MQVERVAKNRVAVTLDTEDYHVFAPLYEAPEPPDEPTLRLFHKLMEQVRLETGFECSCDSVLVELFPEAQEHMRIVITGEEKEPEALYEFLRTRTYEFSSLEPLLGCVAQLCPTQFLYTTLYHYQQQYYLCVCIPVLAAGSEQTTERIHARICEYGTPSALTELFLQEHGELLIRATALETLQKTFFTVR